MHTTNILPSAQSTAEALEGRLGLRLAAQLNLASEQLPHHITERLRVSRQIAIERAGHRRRMAAAASGVVSVGGRQAALSGPPSLWLRLASSLPLVLLVCGLVLIQVKQRQNQIAVAAEIDSALLVDALPPQAYGDPGFSEFLRMHNSP